MDLERALCLRRIENCRLQRERLPLISSYRLEECVDSEVCGASVGVRCLDGRLSGHRSIPVTQLPSMRVLPGGQIYPKPNWYVLTVESRSFVDNDLHRELRQAPIWAMYIVRSITRRTQTHATMKPTTVSLSGFLISRSNMQKPFAILAPEQATRVRLQSRLL